MYELLFGRKRKSTSKRIKRRGSKKSGKKLVKVGKFNVRGKKKTVFKNKSTGKMFVRGKGGRKSAVKKSDLKFGKSLSRRRSVRKSRKVRKASKGRKGGLFSRLRRGRRFSRFGSFGQGRASSLLQMEGPYGSM